MNTYFNLTGVWHFTFMKIMHRPTWNLLTPKNDTNKLLPLLRPIHLDAWQVLNHFRFAKLQNKLLNSYNHLMIFSFDKTLFCLKIQLYNYYTIEFISLLMILKIQLIHEAVNNN